LPSQFRLCVVCRLSVTLVHHTQRIEIFGNVSTLTSMQIFYGDRPRGTPSSGLNARGVAKYSEVGHELGYISETVQDMATGTIID